MARTTITCPRLSAITLSAYLMITVAPGRADAQSPVTGTWRGTSQCVQSDSPCHDEVNIYRFTQVSGKPNTFSGTGSKIVNGREIVMATMEWIFNPEYHALEAELPGSTFRLIVMGNRMEGTLRTGDKVIYRRIHLERAD